MTTLRFAPLQSSVDLSFWSELGKRKLQDYQLSEDPVELHARRPAVPSPVAFDRTSFEPQYERKGCFKLKGEVYVMNNLQNFKQFDKKAAVQRSIEALKQCVLDGTWVTTEGSIYSLQRFVLITYPDLKNHEHLYWFCFPVLIPSQPFQSEPSQTLTASNSHSEQISVEWCRSVEEWLLATDGYSQPLFSTSGLVEKEQETHFHPIQSLADIQAAEMCLLDPACTPGHPSWLLRNVLALVSHFSEQTTPLEVVCLRQRNGKISANDSLLFTLSFQKEPLEEMAHVAGWEVNHLNKTAPRKVNLKSHFDPKMLAEEAVNLNLRLMLWRAAPDLELDTITQTRCLLIGMGTLGCSIARCLLGWGIRHLSLVDSGRVAFSNPVRQYLYEFEDCLEGGRLKAECAAEHLRKIHPSADIQSHPLEVPMPGHPPLTPEHQSKLQHATEELHGLVESHDVIFLLTDNRESRWLPTVMAAALNKIVLCVALGFDSYLIMRHGVSMPSPDRPDRLSCYFCNDIEGPTGTTTHLALDQQCTVARPGLAPIASALAVELLISLLHHPLRGAAGHGLPVEDACADQGATSEQGSALGGVPHMMKGSVFHFSNTCAYGSAFHQCTACSDAVTQAYLQDRWDFVLSAITDEKFLQDVTGLSKLLEEAEALMERPMSDADSEYELM